MHTVVTQPRTTGKWLVRASITLAVVTGMFIFITAATAYITRSTIQTKFEEINLKHQVTKLHNLDGGLYWTHLKFGLGTTAIEIDAHLQHRGLTSYIQGQIIDTKISSTSLANFNGYMDFTLWNRTLYWSLDLHGLDGKWRVPTGYIESHPITINFNISNQLQRWAFDVNAKANELHHDGLPVFHAKTIAFKSAGTFTSNNNQLAQLDTALNLTLDSNYGPINFESSLLSPTQLTDILRNGNIQLRAILPAKLWQLIQTWYPMITQILMNKSAIKSHNDITIINIKILNGNWHTN